jgi:hypothetical protein
MLLSNFASFKSSSFFCSNLVLSWWITSSLPLLCTDVKVSTILESSDYFKSFAIYVWRYMCIRNLTGDCTAVFPFIF